MDGQVQEGTSGLFGDVYDPATGQVQARVDQLLHAGQGGDVVVAGPADLEGRPGIPAGSVIGAASVRREP